MTKLIVALDFDTINDAYALTDKLAPEQCIVKVGSEMYTRFGPAFVESLVAKQYKVFLDLKFHDIPNTVANACKAAADLGVWMLNVHALGGQAMMSAAAQALATYGAKRPLLIAVTILTSTHPNALSAVGLNKPLLEQVLQLAHLASQAGLDGVVSSAQEVSALKKQQGQDFLVITPGIRLQENTYDDQARVVTPEEAFHLGSDYIVVGRPITQATDPKAVVQSILNP